MEKLKYEKEVVGVYISGHPLDEYRLDLNSFCTTTLDNILNENYRQKEVTVAGIVTKIVHRTAKNGNPFCMFTIEDYNGNLEMALFGEDFVKFSNFIDQDRFLFIKGIVQPRWGNQAELELKPKQITLLSEVREKMTNQISVKINLSAVNESLISKLNQVITKYPGKCGLMVHVFDPIEKVEVGMVSRKARVSPSNELLDELEMLGGLSYRLN